ncbi:MULTISPECIES: cytochrome b/b6 domain-containing protein [Sphingomonas]|uniref:Thioredoxin reductase n=2 Tax=Sphingomonas TaxID=13687 RepID=A0ABQ3LPT1_9SPHN|nr:cytochrome b/b6 domain-containing protein [Sphingomonas glacialis]GHH21804.1 thioredoxin reductase [Sphingomonas glacialis]
MTDAPQPTPGQPASPTAVPASTSIYRHRLATRVWHWVNAVTIVIMIGSGLTILNAHPHLYWGEYGANSDHSWFNPPHMPSYLTIPAGYNLAIARRWHLLFALVFGFGLLAFMVASLLNRHFQKDLRIRLKELAPSHLWFDLKEHLAFRFHDPKHPAAFNIFQKLSYALTIFGLIPAMIVSGLALSPAMTAAWPWLLAVVGGRASARSVHFIAASGLVVFIIVHLVLVILAGAWPEVKSMLTGWWRVPEDRAEEAA